jgi:hypothetical protein
MKPKLTSLICLLGYLAAFQSSAATRLEPIVAKFGGECEGVSFQPTARLASLNREVKARHTDPVNTTFCGGFFAYDLNGDVRDEYFVRLSCGATGNCTWDIFSYRPSKFRGTFTAWFFYIHGRNDSWDTLTTYTREGGDLGAIATLRSRQGRYVQTSERTERGDYLAAVPNANGHANMLLTSIATSNKWLDASSGSVLRIMTGPTMLN